MKGRQVVLGQLFGAEAAALMEDGRLVDLIPDPTQLASLTPGTICRGVTDRLMKGQGGVFLRLPDGQRGYLRDRSGIREGASILVQVSGIAEEGKGAREKIALLTHDHVDGAACPLKLRKRKSGLPGGRSAPRSAGAARPISPAEARACTGTSQPV